MYKFLKRLEAQDIAVLAIGAVIVIGILTAHNGIMRSVDTLSNAVDKAYTPVEQDVYDRLGNRYANNLRAYNKATKASREFKADMVAEYKANIDQASTTLNVKMVELDGLWDAENEILKRMEQDEFNRNKMLTYEK